MNAWSLEARIGRLLRARGWTIAVAESCTGGLVMHRLTNVPGSSDYFLGGVVAYADPVKEQMLRVQPATLAAQGAVSEGVAGEMAAGARAVFGATLAVSLTGIAGPGGGTAEKPVGLTYIGLAGPRDLLMVRRHQGAGDREANKASSADAALRLLLEVLEDS